MSNNYDNLVNRAECLGIDINEIVYQLDIGDILGEITYLFNDNLDILSDKELRELIEQGIKGTNTIEWSLNVLEFLRDSNIYINKTQRR